MGALIVSLTLLMCAAIFGLQIASVMDAIDRQTAAIAQMKKGPAATDPSNRPDGATTTRE
ncbi:MAG: hypothetical protein H6948_01105 [Zoogloeaceae bacterium]|nr:hypothetical protein [Zoogloeaceae bacterium]